MKFQNLFVASLSVFALGLEVANATQLSGSIVLNKEKLGVVVNYTEGGFSSKDNIVVGDTNYELASVGNGVFQGRYEMKKNDKIVEQKSVQVFTGEKMTEMKESLKEILDEMQPSNLKEISLKKCHSSNSLVLLSDEITGEIIANCLDLVVETKPASVIREPQSAAKPAAALKKSHK